MGNCAENTAKIQKITREQQDDFALLSYKRSADAVKAGLLAPEIVPVSVPQKRGRYFCYFVFCVEKEKN